MKVYEFENLDNEMKKISEQCRSLPYGPEKKALFSELLDYFELWIDKTLAKQNARKNG